MSISYYKLSEARRARVQQELQPGERVLWAGSPHWRANLGSNLTTAAFGLGWTAVSGFFAVMIGAAVLGLVPFEMNGSAGSHGWAVFFLLFLLPFLAIGVALLLHVARELTAARRRVHVVTDRRILTVDVGRKSPNENRHRSSINFVHASERADGSGTLVISCGIEDDPGDKSRPETITWSGISDVAFVQATLDDRSIGPGARAPGSRPAEVPSALAALPQAVARAAAREIRGERIAWIGRPDAVVAAKWSMLVWLLALPWLYFTLRWEMTSIGLLVQEIARAKSNTPIIWLSVMAVWGIPFVAIGFGMLATPFWVWLRAGSTAHIITDRRIVTVTRGGRRGITVASIEPSRIVSVSCSGKQPGRGTIRIVLGKTLDSDGDVTELAETFWLVEDTARAEQLIADLRARDDRRAA